MPPCVEVTGVSVVCRTGFSGSVSTLDGELTATRADTHVGSEAGTHLGGGEQVGELGRCRHTFPPYHVGDLLIEPSDFQADEVIVGGVPLASPGSPDPGSSRTTVLARPLGSRTARRRFCQRRIAIWRLRKGGLSAIETKIPSGAERWQAPSCPRVALVPTRHLDARFGHRNRRYGSLSTQLLMLPFAVLHQAKNADERSAHERARCEAHD